MTPDSRKISEVLQDVVGDVQEIIRSEVQLARVEIREEASKAASASTTLIAGALLGLYGLGFLLLAFVYGLGVFVPAWASALIVSVLILAVSATLVTKGRSRMREVHAKPDKTIQTVKEDIEWLKRQTR